MKATKTLLTLLIGLLFITACNDELEDNRKTYTGDSFVRFFLLLNSDGQPYTNEVTINNRSATESLTLNNFGLLKIPVLLSNTSPLEDTLKVQFEASSTRGFTGYSITPNKELTFTKDKISDTLTIFIYKRWLSDQTDSINLRLISTNMPDVHIGMPNNIVSNAELHIQLGELRTTVNMPTSRQEIIGIAGETVTFDVDFPDGLLKAELDSIDFFTESNDFDYSIVVNPFQDGDTKISFTITLNENINNDFLEFETLFTLNDLETYEAIGNTTLKIIKPKRATRDLSLNTAAHFYNLNDQYYRNYVELWLDYSSNGECKWRMSSIFSYPVVVQANHPDAVLYDDRGTEDESDDIYHHAFRIGFNSPNAGRTINGFGLKYWFSNEYTDADKSPGFNIPEAIEFYPDSILGDSIGTVQVLEQDLIVSSKESKQYTLSISGKGTYQKLEEDLYEAVFYLDVRNEELYGGTQRGYYKMYNKKNHPEPDPIEKPCINVVEL